MADKKSNLHILSERGQSVWIDSLSRTMLESGELAQLMKDDAVVGVTTNPTIFQKAIADSQDYDSAVAALRAGATSSSPRSAAIARRSGSPPISAKRCDAVSWRPSRNPSECSGSW